MGNGAYMGPKNDSGFVSGILAQKGLFLIKSEWASHWKDSCLRVLRKVEWRNWVAELLDQAMHD